MEITIALAISIISIVITCLNFAFGRKDKSNKETGDNSYRWGVVETKLDTLSKQLSNLSDKFDKFDKDTEEKIKNAIADHIAVYHK